MPRQLRPLRCAEIARERDGARRRDRPARGLGEIRGRLDSRQLRRLEQRVAERRHPGPALGARAVVILAAERDPARSSPATYCLLC